MSETSFTVLRTGMQSLIVDTGRSGPAQAFGVPLGGAMDRRSAYLANWLVGNPPGSPALEMALLGASLRFGGAAQLALTGGRAELKINEVYADPYETLEVAAGDTVSVGAVTAGCRVYLAVGGSWQLPELLDSRSALFVGGRYRNGELQPEEKITIETEAPVHRRALAESEWWQPPAATVAIPVFPGPELAWFSAEAAARFFGSTWAVGKDSNRMGIRLRGEPIAVPERQLLSSPVLPGTIQLPPNGQPLLLLADAQTTGGYPRLATVAETALDELGQLRPGQSVRFTLR